MTVRGIDPYAGDPGPLRIGERLQKCVGDGQRIYKGIRVRPTVPKGSAERCLTMRVMQSFFLGVGHCRLNMIVNTDLCKAFGLRASLELDKHPKRQPTGSRSEVVANTTFAFSTGLSDQCQFSQCSKSPS
jgi:hypothetical protein